MEWLKNTKAWISWERNIIFIRNKKILNLCFRLQILRSYRFVVEVTFKEECDIFRGWPAMAGIAGLVPLCYCAFVVISWALNFLRGFFVGLKFFLVYISRLGFPDCNISSCWLLSERNQKYINISKTEYSIPNGFQLLLVLFILVLHLLN